MRVIDSTIGNIVHNAIIEQNAILWDNCNLRPQVVESHLCNVLSIDKDLASVNIIEAIQQTHYG
jgi:hypothetical protein